MLRFACFRFLIEKSSIKVRQSGAALVEFAMVAPIFLAIMFFAFEFGLIMLIELNLQQGLDAGARLGAVNLATVQTTILQQLQGFVNPAQVTLVIQSYPSFAYISGNNPANLGTANAGVTGTGSEGNVVRYQAQYTYNAVTPVVKSFLGSQVVITVVTVSKNVVPV